MDCKKNFCSNEYSDKECLCYAVPGTENELGDQFCAWRDENFLFKCDPGCCNEGKGCPGECKNVKPQDPTKTKNIIKMKVVEQDEISSTRYDIKELIVLILVYLFIMRLIYT